MKILIMSEFGHPQIKEVNFIPTIGMTVDAFYTPYPKVIGVLAYPSVETIAKLEQPLISAHELDAIVTVS